ncbi:MAG: type II toxin-antitoxin system RelE/ParE family toxin [Methylococcaceae bacterium]|nr:type II toxin-antitoxin system RelE/ParE family toxin [Methylococcaceae bacterium]
MSDKSELIWHKEAINDLEHLSEFLKPKNPKVAFNAARKIIAASNLLLEQPYLGHPIEEMPEFLKLTIPFGKNGYVMKYRIDNGSIIILRVKHTREDRDF